MLSTNNGRPTDGADPRPPEPGPDPDPAPDPGPGSPTDGADPNPDPAPDPGPGSPTDGADHNNGNNFPLRGCKGGYFEGGVRAVGLVHGAGLWRTGIVSEDMHHVNDWLPTLLSAAAAGASADASATHTLELAPSEPPLLMGDGIDNWHVFSRGAPSRRTEMIHVTQAAGSVPGPNPNPNPNPDPR